MNNLVSFLYLKCPRNVKSSTCARQSYEQYNKFPRMLLLAASDFSVMRMSVIFAHFLFHLFHSKYSLLPKKYDTYNKYLLLDWLAVSNAPLYKP